MNWDQLFQMQKKLDTYIQANHQLEESDLFDKKILALLVEVGELANETRCFKFWSNKAASEEAIILEEYVDGLHFILSLGLDKQLTFDYLQLAKAETDMTKVFNLVFEQASAFKHHPSKEKYMELFQSYIALGSLLGFSEESIQSAYMKKNKVNHERQDNGY